MDHGSEVSSIMFEGLCTGEREKYFWGKFD